jgi:hypothetical protein
MAAFLYIIVVSDLQVAKVLAQSLKKTVAFWVITIILVIKRVL